MIASKRFRCTLLALASTLLWFAAACQPAAPPAEEASTAGEEAGEAKDVPQTLELGDLDLRRELMVFVLPSPSEIVAILESDDNLATLRGKLGGGDVDYASLPPWRAALAVGSSMADLLILVPEAPFADVADRLEDIATGLERVGASEEQLEKLRSLRADVLAGAIDRHDLVETFDLLRAEILRQGEEQVGKQNLALIAVGGWARAVNAVARTAQETGDVPPGADVLKLRLVVTTLMDEIGSDDQVGPVEEALRKVLPVTHAVRPTDPTPQELGVLIDATDDILGLTRT